MINERLTNHEHAVLTALGRNQESAQVAARSHGVNLLALIARTGPLGWTWEKDDHRIVLTKKGRKRLETSPDVTTASRDELRWIIRDEAARREAEKIRKWIEEGEADDR